MTIQPKLTFGGSFTLAIMPHLAYYEQSRLLENSRDTKLLANMAKHFAFIRCAESNLYGIVDAQIAVVESELLAGTVVS